MSHTRRHRRPAAAAPIVADPPAGGQKKKAVSKSLSEIKIELEKKPVTNRVCTPGEQSGKITTEAPSASPKAAGPIQPAPATAATPATIRPRYPPQSVRQIFPKRSAATPAPTRPAVTTGTAPEGFGKGTAKRGTAKIEARKNLPTLDSKFGKGTAKRGTAKKPPSQIATKVSPRCRTHLDLHDWQDAPPRLGTRPPFAPRLQFCPVTNPPPRKTTDEEENRPRGPSSA